jgi:hypothetical protein
LLMMPIGGGNGGGLTCEDPALVEIQGP